MSFLKLLKPLHYQKLISLLLSFLLACDYSFLYDVKSAQSQDFSTSQKKKSCLSSDEYDDFHGTQSSEKRISAQGEKNLIYCMLATPCLLAQWQRLIKTRQKVLENFLSQMIESELQQGKSFIAVLEKWLKKEDIERFDENEIYILRNIASTFEKIFSINKIDETNREEVEMAMGIAEEAFGSDSTFVCLLKRRLSHFNLVTHMESLALKETGPLSWRDKPIDEENIDKIKMEVKQQSISLGLINGKSVWIDELLLKRHKDFGFEELDSFKDFLFEFFKKQFANKEYLPVSDEIIIGLLSNSTHLFEDHQGNGFIGVNRQLFPIFPGSISLELRKKLLLLGLRHELAHEAVGKLKGEALIKFEREQLLKDAKFALRLGITPEDLSKTNLFTDSSFAHAIQKEAQAKERRLEKEPPEHRLIRALYVRWLSGEKFISDAIDITEILKTSLNQGMIAQGFPLPFDMTWGHQDRLGLGKDLESVKVIVVSGDDGQLKLEFTGYAAERSSTKGVTHRDPIRKAIWVWDAEKEKFVFQQEEALQSIKQFYKDWNDKKNPKPLRIDVSKILREGGLLYGKMAEAFPLPNGESWGEQENLGIGENLKEVLATFSQGENGDLKLVFEGYKKDSGKLTGKSEWIWNGSKFIFQETEEIKKIKEFYKEWKEKHEPNTLRVNLSKISGSILSSGKLPAAFPLPNGESIGDRGMGMRIGSNLKEVFAVFSVVEGRLMMRLESYLETGPHKELYGESHWIWVESRGEYVLQATTMSTGRRKAGSAPSTQKPRFIPEPTIEPISVSAQKIKFDGSQEAVDIGIQVITPRKINIHIQTASHALTVEKHLERFKEEHPDEEPLTVAGNRNLLVGSRFVSWRRGRLVHVASANLARSYTSLVVYKDHSVRIELLSYRHGKVFRINERTGELQEITDSVAYTTYGLGVLPWDEGIVSKEHENSENLFKFPRTADFCVGKKEMILDRKHHLMRKALNGEPIALDLKIDGINPENFQRALLNESDYVKVGNPSQVVSPGQYTIANGKLFICLLPNVCPYHFMGINKDGQVVNVIISGKTGTSGASIHDALKLLRKEGIERAILVENEEGVFLKHNGSDVVASSNREEKLRSVLIFSKSKQADISQTSPDLGPDLSSKVPSAYLNEATDKQIDEEIKRILSDPSEEDFRFIQGKTEEGKTGKLKVNPEAEQKIKTAVVRLTKTYSDIVKYGVVVLRGMPYSGHFSSKRGGRLYIPEKILEIAFSQNNEIFATDVIEDHLEHEYLRSISQAQNAWDSHDEVSNICDKKRPGIHGKVEKIYIDLIESQAEFIEHFRELIFDEILDSKTKSDLAMSYIMSCRGNASLITRMFDLLIYEVLFSSSPRSVETIKIAKHVILHLKFERGENLSEARSALMRAYANASKIKNPSPELQQLIDCAGLEIFLTAQEDKGNSSETSIKSNFEIIQRASLVEEVDPVSLVKAIQKLKGRFLDDDMAYGAMEILTRARTRLIADTGMINQIDDLLSKITPGFGSFAPTFEDTGGNIALSRYGSIAEDTGIQADVVLAQAGSKPAITFTIAEAKNATGNDLKGRLGQFMRTETYQNLLSEETRTAFEGSEEKPTIMRVIKGQVEVAKDENGASYGHYNETASDSTQFIGEKLLEYLLDEDPESLALWIQVEMARKIWQQKNRTSDPRSSWQVVKDLKIEQAKLDRLINSIVRAKVREDLKRFQAASASEGLDIVEYIKRAIRESHDSNNQTSEVAGVDIGSLQGKYLEEMQHQLATLLKDHEKAERTLQELRPAARATLSIVHAFDAYYAEFNAITNKAKERFEKCQWHEALQDGKERIRLYRAAIDRVEASLKSILGDQIYDPANWAEMKERFLRAIHDRYDDDLALTFFYSAQRRLFSKNGVSVEYSDDGVVARSSIKTASPYNTYKDWGTTQNLVEHIFQKVSFDIPYQNLERDCGLAAKLLDQDFAKLLPGQKIDSIEILKPVFFRNKGAYVIGRIRSGDQFIPLAFALLNDAQGIVIDAVITGVNEVSRIFSYTRSNFHVETKDYHELVDFLDRMMPNKGRAAIYSSIGFIQPSKLELIKNLRAHIEESREHFRRAEGIEGSVMKVFAMKEFPYVFKIIMDNSNKKTFRGKQHVIDQYQKVHEADRAGRMLDTHLCKDLKFEKSLFHPDYLEELLKDAPSSVAVEGENVILKHVYMQRRMIPLNIYLEKVKDNPAELKRILTDFGDCIKDLAASGIFVADLLTKNFGVTHYGRVVLYDFDDIEEVKDIEFKYLWSFHSQPLSISLDNLFEIMEEIDRKEKETGQVMTEAREKFMQGVFQLLEREGSRIKKLTDFDVAKDELRSLWAITSQNEMGAGDEEDAPSFYIPGKTILLDEIKEFMRFSEPAWTIFTSVHSDLFTTTFWNEVKRKLERNEVIDIFPYEADRRLHMPQVKAPSNLIPFPQPGIEELKRPDQDPTSWAA